MNLSARTRSMLAQALMTYHDSPRATGWLERHLDRLDDPLRLTVVGPPQSGKSTMVDALGGYPAAELTLIDAPAPAPHTIEGICMEADAVLYLVRHPHGADLDFLHTVQDHPIARAGSVNALIVLSRADELGGGRVDALISARQVARRYRRETEVRGLCQDVVPVAGLLAGAAQTLTQLEFDTLENLARVPREELEPHLLSADRFAALPAPAPALLERFGLFGVRLAVTLIRRGTRTSPALVDQLVQRSGLTDLRGSIDRCFIERRDVLKARSALLGLEVVLRMEPRPTAAALARDLEKTLASAHDFRELRLLAALRTNRVSLPAELNAEAVRLVGGEGTRVAERLGPEGTDLHHTIRRWRQRSEDPTLSSGERRAAAVVLRSCEAIAAGVL